MSYRSQRLIQQILLFAVVLAMLLTHNSSVSFNAHAMITAVALGGVLAITWGWRKKKGYLLVSPLDFGWLSFGLFTFASVLAADTPRRSVESWMWFSGIQIPIFYGALYLFRRLWAEYGLFRALLGAGGYLYLMTLTFVVAYFTQWQAARAAGITPAGLRLFGVMDHPNIFAMFIAMATPCIVAYMFTPIKRLERAACALWLVGALVAILATGSRTGLGAMLVGTGVAVVLAVLAHPAPPVQRFSTWARAHRTQAAALLGGAALVGIVALTVVVYLQFGRPRQDDGGGRLSFYRTALAMFSRRPVLGFGPGGFVRTEIVSNSVPPYEPLMPHAHDMFLNTLAESGLLGLIGFLFLLAAAFWTCITVWRTQPARRVWVAGPIAGLIAFCILGLPDSPVNQFGPFFVGTLLLAFVVANLPAPQAGTQRIRQWLAGGAVWAVVLLAVVILIPYSTVWSVTRPDAPAPADGNGLAAAAQKLDQVAKYDSSDPLVSLQASYLWAGAAASTDKPPTEWLQNALQQLERGAALDPDLSIHAVNLSALYLRLGKTAEAVRTAKQATQRAPNDAVAWLNLGLALETAGQAEAVDAYEKALLNESRWSAMGFWQSSPVRSKAYQAFMAASDADQRYYDLLYAGDAARLAGDDQKALAAYNAALKVAPGSIAFVYIRGLIALASHEVEKAQQLMKSVTLMDIDIVYPYDQPPLVDAWLMLGDLALAKGDVDAAYHAYSAAYTLLTSRGMDGLGSKGNWSYAVLGYQRFARINDYIPGVLTIDISPNQATRFHWLARYLIDHGNKTAALGVYRSILQSNPEDAVAKAGVGDVALAQNYVRAISPAGIVIPNSQ